MPSFATATKMAVRGSAARSRNRTAAIAEGHPRSAKAWLEGKLLVGLLIEHMVDFASSFSPWGYSLAATPEPLARS